MASSPAYKPLKLPVQARSKVTFDAILDAAAQLLTLRGYTGTTTNRIAERAGVSIGSVYEYFPGKDAIFATLKQRLDRETSDFVLRQFEDAPSLSPQELLARVLTARIEAALLQPKLEALLRSEVPGSVLEAQAKSTFDGFAEKMRGFAAIHAEAVRLEDSDAAMNLGVHVVELTVNHMAATQPDQLRDPIFVAGFVDMMTRWILTDEHASVEVR